MWRSKDVAVLINGVLVGDPDVPAAGCLLDSRKAKGGGIFFALLGEKVDGHDFIVPAWQNGADVAVADKARLTSIFNVPPGKALILVDSVSQALHELARAWREAIGAKVVGITGSNGKTTTKDMVAAVLSRRYKVYKNQENHNNELGLPLTVLNAPPDTEILVLEMGMRGLGEIRVLTEIARPDTGVITNIGTTHLELLGSEENIARAKWELIAALPPAGWAILNAEDRQSVGKAKTDPHPVRFYGLNGAWTKAEVAGEALTAEGALGTAFTVVWGREKARIRLPLPGEHNVLDALAALAVGTVYGISLAEGGLGLERLELSRMRLEVLPGLWGSTLISDVYNANPVSMQASLRILKERAGGHPTVAILGEMYELGVASEPGHRSVGRVVAELGLNRLITVGALAEDIARGARAAGLGQEKIEVCATREEAVDKAGRVLQDLPPGAWVLVKGSRGMKMERVSAALQIAGRKGRF